MSLKQTLLTLLFISSTFLAAQVSDKFGDLSASEKEMISYEKDTEASAVILYEKGDYYFEVIDDRIWLVKNFHRKTKILTKEGFDHATVSIPYYKNKSTAEKVTEIEAITYTDDVKTYVAKNKMFPKNINERWSETTFAFPNVKEGSIVEYKYKLISPFHFNLDGWSFQSSIPKIYSEFNAKIPGNYLYNRSLTGELKLDINDATIEKNCFRIPGITKAADCEVLKYVMKDIPAFKEEEDFMLAASNYISSIDFELSIYHRLDGTKDKYTKSWKDVDKEFRYDKDIGKQLTKKGFFEKKVPADLLTESDELKKAKNIYAFIQNHYTWNGKKSTYGKARVKAAFNKNVGNAWEINMSLINLLNAADIPSNLVLSSTRKSGLPKRSHPVITDFNYILVLAKINGENYILDATDKHLSFGMLPFRALNHYGRVMDFKNESYWLDINPFPKNRNHVRTQIKFDVDTKKGYGIIDMNNSGYDAIETRIAIEKNSEDEYLQLWEDEITGDLELTSYKLNTERSTESNVSERFEFEFHDVLDGDLVYFNPFLFRFFDKNPFTLRERNYPIDFGYPRQYKYDINIVLPEGYQVHELPNAAAVKLGENMVLLKFNIQENSGNIQLTFDLDLKNHYFVSADYKALKQIFKKAVEIQTNSLVVLKKE